MAIRGADSPVHGDDTARIAQPLWKTQAGEIGHTAHSVFYRGGKGATGPGYGEVRAIVAPLHGANGSQAIQFVRRRNEGASTRRGPILNFVEPPFDTGLFFHRWKDRAHFQEIT